MKISDLFNFVVRENYAEAGGFRIYFLRFSPPNLSIMTDGEKAAEISKFQEFYESYTDRRFQIFSLDKTENLEANKAFWQSLQKGEEDDPCREIRDTVIRQIGSIESTSSSVGRAFYFVLRIKDPEELSRFETNLSAKSIPYYIADRQEVVTVLRNYILREFVNFDLYDLEKEVEQLYADETKGKRQKAG